VSELAENAIACHAVLPCLLLRSPQFVWRIVVVSVVVVFFLGYRFSPPCPFITPPIVTTASLLLDLSEMTYDAQPSSLFPSTHSSVGLTSSQQNVHNVVNPSAPRNQQRSGKIITNYYVDDHICAGLNWMDIRFPASTFSFSESSRSAKNAPTESDVGDSGGGGG
jgi:hypothetical protein